MDRQFSLLEPVLYGDVFDFPVTLEEAHRYCPVALSKEELRRAFDHDEAMASRVEQVDGYYVLKGRRGIVPIRRERQAIAKRSWRQARRVARAIQYVPFLEGMLVTGSLAVGNTRPGDDLDFLVLVHPNRIWFVFAVCGVLQRFLLKRRLCVNYYLSRDHLRLAMQTPYVARELLQARPIAGAEPCRRLFRENRWARVLFPNATDPPAAAEPIPLPYERRGFAKQLSKLAERLLGGTMGNGLEAVLASILEHRLGAHYGKHRATVPPAVLQRALDGIELRFHGNDYESVIGAKLASRTAALRAQLHDESTDP